MTVQVDLKDWRGEPIEVGATVVYPARVSSSMWMVEAEVKEIFQKQTGWRGELSWALKVQPLRMTRNRDSLRDKRATTLTELSRVTVIG